MPNLRTYFFVITMKINLKERTKCLEGELTPYWYENSFTGLKKTLFYRLNIPLSDFDSGLEYVNQPEKTSIMFEWLEFGIIQLHEIDELIINETSYPKLECSIYLGSAHNRCLVKHVQLVKIQHGEFEVKGELLIDFESEGVAENEFFDFSTIVKYM